MAVGAKPPLHAATSPTINIPGTNLNLLVNTDKTLIPNPFQIAPVLKQLIQAALLDNLNQKESAPEQMIDEPDSYPTMLKAHRLSQFPSEVASLTTDKIV